jgi:uncharacterized protein GlcG (DUF336 family)
MGGGAPFTSEGGVAGVGVSGRMVDEDMVLVEAALK